MQTAIVPRAPVWHARFLLWYCWISRLTLCQHRLVSLILLGRVVVVCPILVIAFAAGLSVNS